MYRSPVPVLPVVHRSRIGEVGARQLEKPLRADRRPINLGMIALVQMLVVHRSRIRTALWYSTDVSAALASAPGVCYDFTSAEGVLFAVHINQTFYPKEEIVI